MSVVREMNQTVFREYLTTLPPGVRKAVEAFPPDRLYRMKGGHRVTIESYGEEDDGSCKTCTVRVSGDFNLVVFEREVFGVSFDSLEECDWPVEGEVTGTALTKEEEVDSFLERARDEMIP